MIIVYYLSIVTLSEYFFFICDNHTGKP